MCPWEDSGGLWGFYEKVKILKGKKSEERDEIIEWLCDLGVLDGDGNIEKQIKKLDLSKFENIILTPPTSS